MVNITDNGATISVIGIIGTNNYNLQLNKNVTSITKTVSNEHLTFYEGGSYINSFPYVEIALPVTANIDVLISTIQAWLSTGGGGGATEVTLQDILTQVTEINTEKGTNAIIASNFQLAVWMGLLSPLWEIKQGICTFYNYPYGSDLFMLYNAGQYFAEPSMFFPTGDEQMYVSSTSVDDFNGTLVGASNAMVQGYLMDGTFQSEVVALNGLTGVATANLYHRITNFNTGTAATGAGNLGRLYIGNILPEVDGTSYSPQAMVEIGENVHRNAIIYVPTGAKFLVEKLTFHATSLIPNNQEVPAHFQAWMRLGDGIDRLLCNVYGKDFELTDLYGIPYALTGPADIYLRGGAVDTMDSTVSITGIIEVTILKT